MFYKSPRENFAESIIRLIEGEDPALNYSDEDLGRYVRILYKRYRLGADYYYNDRFGLYTDVDNV